MTNDTGRPTTVTSNTTPTNTPAPDGTALADLPAYMLQAGDLVWNPDRAWFETCHTDGVVPEALRKPTSGGTEDPDQVVVVATCKDGAEAHNRARRRETIRDTIHNTGRP